MKQPEGFIRAGFEDYACKLVHTIYGTMQGAHDWYKTLSKTYVKLKYTPSNVDLCIRYKKEGNNYTITNTWTDDTFGASKTKEEAQKRKEEIRNVWEIKDVGETEYFLGMRVQQDLDLGTVQLTQCPYWEYVLHCFGLDNITPRNTPLPVGIILDKYVPENGLRETSNG